MQDLAVCTDKIKADFWVSFWRFIVFKEEAGGDLRLEV